MIPEQKSQHAKIQALQTTFSRDVSQILLPDNPSGKKLINYLQRLAKQLNIRNFDVREVISESTMRGLDSIERKGEAINNASAWLSSVGTRVIKDQVDAEIRARKLAAKHVIRTETSDSWIALVLAEEGEAAHQAVQLLSLEDQDILRLRYIEEMSYKDIQAHYLETTGVFVKLATLRKRESRAVQRLKTRFREIYE